MPLYGRGFTLDDPNSNGLYATANQPIDAGPYTGEVGFWGYYEVPYIQSTRNPRKSLIDSNPVEPIS